MPRCNSCDHELDEDGGCAVCVFYDDFKKGRVWRDDLRAVVPIALLEEADIPVGYVTPGWTYNMPGPDTDEGWCYPGSPGWIVRRGNDYLSSSGMVHAHLTTAEFELFLYLADR